jgi:hypothetical protein
MKIALIGSAPSSVKLGPYFDKSYAEFVQGKQPKYPPAQHIEEEWEIWGCSPGAFGQVARATRWFEVHRWEPGQPWFSPEYCQFLREFKGKVYTGAAIPEIKNHVVYPTDRVEEEFGAYFLTSSLSLMMALAILEIEDARKQRRQGVVRTDPIATPGGLVRVDDQVEKDEDDVIGFWGVDMAATEEYGYQRAGCQFFVLEALRRGIGVYVPPESDLLRPMPVYGICEWDHQYIKMTARAREFNQRKAQHEQELAAAQANLRFMQGAVDDLNYTVNTWTSKYGLPSGVVLRKQG